MQSKKIISSSILFINNIFIDSVFGRKKLIGFIRQ